jgi:O-acetylhomoserine/O-acetylserine sulfhydrylase-like pyridoxal-dependent enzyme
VGPADIRKLANMNSEGSKPEDGEALFRGERQGCVYGRPRNPTQALFEERMASLEGAEAALASASGMAASAC